LMMLWYLISAAHCLAIVVDSSDGLPHVENWPSPILMDHLGEGLYVIVSASISAVPGWALGRLMGLPADQAAWVTAGGAFLTFPFCILSALDASSPWGVASGRLATSFARCPLQWLLFYAGSGLLLAGVGIAALWLLARGPLYLTIVAPLTVAALWLYFRALGRLAWCIAEVTPGPEEKPTDEQRAD
jgi:hypothetical protein